MTVRLRTLRRTDAVRRLVSESRLTPDRLVLPIFAGDGLDAEQPIAALAPHARWPAERAGAVAKEAESLGIPAVLVFGIPDVKDAHGSRAYAADGPAQRAIAAIKSSAPSLVVFADTCLCSFTSHGHCGLLRGEEIDDDATLDALARTAAGQAAAGADFVAPSDMMDGRVAAIRRALDEAGHASCGILSYSAKFASALYGPFRDAAGCAPQFGDRRSYQIEVSARRQAIRSIERDVAEGADMVMVKPALPCLDIVREARDRVDVPVAAYNVGGEYAMVRAAAERALLDERAVALEILASILRAGADFVVTYHAEAAARWLGERDG